jgi:hypothetical protein
MPFDPLGSRLIQNINFVIYQTYDATLAAGQDGDANESEDSGDGGWIDDTSTSNGWNTQLGPGVGHTGPESNNGNNPGSTGGPGTPGPQRPTIPPNMVRRIPPGGSAIQPNRRRPAPVFRVTITADDELKLRATVFTWDGDEFSDAGLQ